MPLPEPWTTICEMSAAGTPRKLICEAGEASGVPLSGEIVTWGSVGAVAATAPAGSPNPATRPTTANSAPRERAAAIAQTVALAASSEYSG